MRTMMMLALLLTPLAAKAEHLDVIQAKLKEKCSLQTYVAIKNDFNEQWGNSHGYRAEIAVPVQSSDLGSLIWVGHTSSAEAFGRAWDAWRTELADPKSVAAKLNERFEKCSTNEARRGYDVF